MPFAPLLPLLFSLAQASEPEVVVQLWTLSPGDDLPSSGGHTLLRVKTFDPPSDRTYDFGRYFLTTTFVADLMMGDLWFELESLGTRQTAEWIASRGRTIESRTLEMPTETALALRDRLIALEQPELRAYRYDPAYANCVTRVRDLLDELVFAGAWSAAASALPGEPLEVGTDHLLAGRPTYRWLVHGVYGPLSQAPQTQWQSTYLPFQLGDALDALQAGAGPVPLPEGVRIHPPKLFHDAKVQPEPPVSLLRSPPFYAWCALMLGMLPAVLAPASRGARAALRFTTLIWAVLGGSLGLAVWLLSLQSAPLYAGNLVRLGLHPLLWTLPALLTAALTAPEPTWRHRVALPALVLFAALPTLGAAIMVPYGQVVPAHLPPLAALQLVLLAAALRVRRADLP